MTGPIGKAALAVALLGVLGLSSCGPGDCGPMRSYDGTWSGVFVGRDVDSTVTIDEASGVVVIERADPRRGRVVTTWRIRSTDEFYAST